MLFWMAFPAFVAINSKYKVHYSKCITETHLANSAVPACFHMVLALIASVDKAVLSLVVQLNQHAHGAPLAPPEGAELPVLVPGKSQKRIPAIHQITGEQGVRVNNRGQSVHHGGRVEMNDKEHLKQKN